MPFSVAPSSETEAAAPGGEDRRRRAVVYGLTKRGFFSEVNLLVCNYAYALAEGEDFYVDADRFVAPWEALFQSPLPGKEDLDPDSYERVVLCHPKTGEDEWRRRRQFVTEACEQGLPVRVDGLSFDGTWLELVFQISKLLFHPTRNVLEQAQSHAATLGLDAGSFCAVHIRRGDKTTGRIRNGEHFAEGEKAPFSAYLEALAKLAPGVRRLFVLTDDFREVAGAREAYPEFEILTLSQPGEEGYFQQSYRQLSWGDRFEAVQRLIAEVTIGIQSKAFAGLYRSNVSLMLAALHPRPDLCVSVDSQRAWRPS